MSRALVVLVTALLVCLSVSLFGESFIAYQYAYYYDILITIGINVILATSLNLVNGYTGQFSLGHAGFMAVGAYASASWSNHLDPYMLGWIGGANNPFATNLAFLISMLFAGLLAAIAGFAVGVPSLRLKGDYLAIATLGFGEIIRVAILNTDFLGASRGLSVAGHYTNLFWTYGSVVVCVYVVLGLVHSTYGRGFLTVRDDEVAAEAMGINTTRYKVQAFVVASFFAGIAGALYAHSRRDGQHARSHYRRRHAHHFTGGASDACPHPVCSVGLPGIAGEPSHPLFAPFDHTDAHSAAGAVW
jgi:branched-chain amino acid transport system permease protein